MIATGLAGAFALYVVVGVLIALFILIGSAMDPNMATLNFSDMVDVLVLFVLAWPMMMRLYHDNDGPWRG